MTKKIVFGVALALVIAVIAVPSVSAACNPPKSASTYNSGTGAYAFWTTTLPSATSTLTGKIWSGATDFTGNCNGNAVFLYFGTVEGTVGMNLNLGDGCVPGCPTGSLSVMAAVSDGTKTEFLVTQAPETPSGAINFDYSATAHPMVELPRPRATASSRAGSNINLNLAIDAVSSGLYDGTAGQITGYNILSASSPGDPGRNASAYGNATSLPAAAGGAAAGAKTVDCSNTAQDQWVVTQLVTAAGPSAVVSSATRVRCNQALADPKFKIIPKKGMGTGPVKN